MKQEMKYDFRLGGDWKRARLSIVPRLPSPGYEKELRRTAIRASGVCWGRLYEDRSTGELAKLLNLERGL